MSHDIWRVAFRILAPCDPLLFDRYRREVLRLLIIYPWRWRQYFSTQRMVLPTRLQNVATHFLSDSRNYTEFMKAICLPYLSFADFCRHLCRISLRIQSVGDRSRNTLCWDQSTCTVPLFSTCVACNFLAWNIFCKHIFNVLSVRTKVATEVCMSTVCKLKSTLLDLYFATVFVLLGQKK